MSNPVSIMDYLASTWALVSDDSWMKKLVHSAPDAEIRPVYIQAMLLSFVVVASARHPASVRFLYPACMVAVGYWTLRTLVALGHTTIDEARADIVHANLHFWALYGFAHVVGQLWGRLFPRSRAAAESAAVQR